MFRTSNAFFHDGSRALVYGLRLTALAGAIACSLTACGGSSYTPPSASTSSGGTTSTSGSTGTTGGGDGATASGGNGAGGGGSTAAETGPGSSGGSATSGGILIGLLRELP
jgi:hypothetical protein